MRRYTRMLTQDVRRIFGSGAGNETRRRHALPRLRYLVMATVMAMVLLAQMSPEAQALDRRVRVINNTSYTMTHFYASNITRRGWEEDILGDDVLISGSSLRVNIDDGTGHCRFDLKAVFANEAKVIRNNVDVCRIGSWTIHD
jgi:hypothetical protein